VQAKLLERVLLRPNLEKKSSGGGGVAATPKALAVQGSGELYEEGNSPERAAVDVELAASHKSKKRRALEAPSQPAPGEVSWSTVTSY